MIRLVIGLILGGAGLAATAGVAVFDLRKPDAPNALLPAATFCALLLTLLSPEPLSRVNLAAIALALILILIAQILVTFVGAPQVVLVATRLMGALLITVALAAPHSWHWPSPWVLVAVAAAALVYALFRHHLGYLWPWLIAYLVVHTLLLWAAIDLTAQFRTWWTLFALAGVLLFNGAELLRAVDFLRKPWPRAVIAARVLEGLGYLALAWSAWGVHGLLSLWWSR